MYNAYLYCIYTRGLTQVDSIQSVFAQRVNAYITETIANLTSPINSTMSARLDMTQYFSQCSVNTSLIPLRVACQSRDTETQMASCTKQETLKFNAIWGDEIIQQQLEGYTRNKEVFVNIYKKLEEESFTRSFQQSTRKSRSYTRTTKKLEIS